MTQSINQQLSYQKLTEIVNNLIDNNHIYQENIFYLSNILINKSGDKICVP